MKKSFIILSVLGLLMLGGASVFALSLPSGLVVFHEFDEDLTDSKGGNDFVEVGLVTTGTVVYNEEGSSPIHMISGNGGNVGYAKDLTGVIPNGDFEVAFAFKIDNPIVDNNQTGFLFTVGDPLDDGEIILNFEPRSGGNFELNVKNPANTLDELTLDAGVIDIDEVHFVRMTYVASTDTVNLFFDDMSIPVDSDSFDGDVDFSAIDTLVVIVGGETIGGPDSYDGSIGNIGIYDELQNDDYFEDTYNAGDVLPLEIRLNDPTNLAITDVEIGGTTDNTQPEVTFDLTVDNASFQLNYGVQIATDSEFMDAVVTYDSDLVDQGEISFVVGQAVGDGLYGNGMEGQELEDSNYYVRVVGYKDDLVTEIIEYNDGDVAFTVDTTVAEESSSSNSSGSVVKNVSFANNSTYETEVERVMTEKIVTENPTNETNKCEALTMMARVFAWEFETVTESSFNDVPEWCMSVANFAVERGIVEGRTETQLGLDTPVTRDEIAVMLFRELEEQEYSFNGKIEISFVDVLTVWAEDAVNKLAKEGIVKGYADGSFGGENSILKQDLGVMLLRVKDRL